MRIRAALCAICALITLQLPSLVTAQSGSGGTQPVVGTWLLSGLERATPGQPPTRVMNPVGMLIQSANGYVLQIVSQSARPATLNAADQFITYRAFWGTFTVDLGAESHKMAWNFGQGIACLRAHGLRVSLLPLSSPAQPSAPISTIPISGSRTSMGRRQSPGRKSRTRPRSSG